MKAPTTPETPKEGVLDSVEGAAEELGLAIEDLLTRTDAFYHATTLATNAMVEHTGASVGLITTKGFPDELHIAQTKSRTAGLSRREIQHYSQLDKPEPIVEKPFIETVTERVDYKGEAVVPLDEADTRAAIRNVLEKDVDVIAVAYLWSFANSAHEQRTAELVEEVADGDVFVTLSSEVAPRIGEYSRTASTVINAYTGPLMTSYRKTLKNALEDRGLDAPIYLMQSNGGVVPLEHGTGTAVKAIGAGPAAGVTGSRYLGDHLQHDNVICTDVGGTSFDVGMVIDGELKTAPQQVINKHTLHQTSVDIESIGSGGGSIAWVDDVGQLHVGPESAGADPGPVCYGRGGERPTVTDADLILGYLDPAYFLGGDRSLDTSKAIDAMETHVADPLGISPTEAAAGVVRIANSHMADLLHKLTIQRGFDPRRFNLYAYGGAGPMHASFYGPEIEVDSVVVPLSKVASVYSAFGITATDITQIRELSDTTNEPFDPKHVNERLASLRDAVESEILANTDATADDLEFDYSADMRYANQVNELEVTLPGGELSEEQATSLGERFERVYEQRYGPEAIYGESPREIVTYRVRGRLPTEDPAIEAEGTAGGSPEVWKRREVYWESVGDFVETAIYDGTALGTGMTVQGPAIVQMRETTVTVRPHQEASIDDHGNIEIETGDSE